jgi:hypothetical protein
MECSASGPPGKTSCQRLGNSAAWCIALPTCSIDSATLLLQPRPKWHPRDVVCERWDAYEPSIHRFDKDYESKYPKAVKSLVTDVSHLMIHFEFPSSHWKDLQNTNLVRTTFATTVKLRTPVPKGWLTSCRTDVGVQAVRGRATNLAPTQCPQLFLVVRTGVVFTDGPSR